MYQANINDVGCKLRVICTPVREDGVQGKPCACDTDILKLSPSLETQINAYLLAGEAEFKVIKKGKNSTQTLLVLKDGLKMKDGEALILKEEFSNHFKIYADINNTEGYSILIERQNGKQVVLFVNSVDERDKIVATLRSFCEKYLETLL